MSEIGAPGFQTFQSQVLSKDSTAGVLGNPPEACLCFPWAPQPSKLERGILMDVKEACHVVTSLFSPCGHTCLNVPEFPGHGKLSALSANTSWARCPYSSRTLCLSVVSHRNLYHLISQDGQWEEIWGGKNDCREKKLLKMLSVSNKGDTKEKEQLGD